MCSLKNPTFRGGEFTKNRHKGVDCLKREAWTVFDLRGGGGAWQERGRVFLRGG